MSEYKFETLQLHVGQEQADPATDARAVPIYQTTSYVFRNSQHAADRFGLADAGNIYGRLTNSTQDVLEKRIAALEGGSAALALASGAAAITYTIQALAANGGHIVAQKTIYGGSYNLLAHTLPQYGITTTFVDAHNLKEIEDAIQDNTRAIYLETLGNPNSDIPDIDAIAELAHRNGLPVVVDNTFGTPFLIRPIEHGADIVVHSATKFIGGHGTTLGGVVVESGKFNWKASGKYPNIADANPSYHGISFYDAVGAAAFVTYIRAILLRDTGATISPFNAFLLLQGVETLSLRLERHAENTKKVVEYLTSPTAARPSSPLRSRAVRRRLGSSSTTSKSSRCSRTSRTSRASSSIPLPPPTPSSPPRSCTRRASLRTPSACPSARSISTTSSQIWITPSRRFNKTTRHFRRKSACQISIKEHSDSSATPPSLR